MEILKIISLVFELLAPCIAGFFAGTTAVLLWMIMRGIIDIRVITEDAGKGKK